MTCHILYVKEFKPGDQAPSGYLDWHEWARVQHKAGLRQQQCGKCSLWKYPQELSGEEVRCETQTRRGKAVVTSSPVCNECHLRALQAKTGERS